MKRHNPLGLFQVTILLLALFLVGGLLTGCENKAPEKSSGQYDEIIKDINEVQVRIAQNTLYTKASLEEKNSVKEGLRVNQNAFSILNKDSDNKMAVKMIDRGLGLLERYPDQERDESVMRPLKARMCGEVAKVARSLNMSLDARCPVYFTEFSTAFSEDSGFSMFPAGSWNTGLVLNGIRQRATLRSNAFRGSIKRGWLLLPPIDLSNVERPAFRLEHTITLSQGDRNSVFDKYLFQLKAFKVKVSTTYVGQTSAPWEMRDCELIEDPVGSGNYRVQKMGEECDWMTYDVGATKHRTDSFFKKFSDVIELGEFRKKNVTIAFVVDQTPLVYDVDSCHPYYSPNTCKRKLAEKKDLGSHNLTWDLFSFEIMGAGKMEFTKGGRIGDIFDHSFASPKIVNHYKVADLEENQDADGNQNVGWKPAGRGRDATETEWVMVESDGRRPVSAGLLSPVYDVSGRSHVYLNLSENYNWRFKDCKPFDFEPFEVLVSYDYDGGDINVASWERLKRDFKTDNLECDSFRNNTIFGGQRIDSKRTGQFTLLFWMKSSKRLIWQVDSYNIKGVGGPLETIDFVSPPCFAESCAVTKEPAEGPR